MTIRQSVTTCIRKYFTFSGRATRSEYAPFAFISGGLLIILTAIFVRYIYSPKFYANPLGYDEVLPWFITLSLANLVLFIPFLSATWRRLHDAGHNGWWMGCFLMLGLGLCIPPALNFFCIVETLPLNEFGKYLIVSFIALVPLSLPIIKYLCDKSQEGTNEFGPDPNEPDRHSRSHRH